MSSYKYDAERMEINTGQNKRPQRSAVDCQSRLDQIKNDLFQSKM